MTKNDKKISKNQKTSISSYKTQKNTNFRPKIYKYETKKSEIWSQKIINLRPKILWTKLHRDLEQTINKNTLFPVIKHKKHKK